MTETQVFFDRMAGIVYAKPLASEAYRADNCGCPLRWVARKHPHSGRSHLGWLNG